MKYRGRARSTLEDGERIIIIKSDGNVLIHRPSGLEPVNYMASSRRIVPVLFGNSRCYFRTKMTDSALIIDAFSRRSRESLRVSTSQIYAVLIMDLIDTADFHLYVSEREVQRAILAKPEMVEKSFTPISYEKKIEPGFIDVYGIDKDGKFVVIELKRIRAGSNSVMQLAKYVEHMRSTMNREVRGILMAPQITKGVQKLLETLGLEYKRVDLKECSKVLTASREPKIKDYF